MRDAGFVIGAVGALLAALVIGFILGVIADSLGQKRELDAAYHRGRSEVMEWLLTPDKKCPEKATDL